MEKPPRKPDIQAEDDSVARRLEERAEAADPLMNIPNIDLGFVKYLCSLNIKIPDNPYLGQAKMGDSNVRKLKRDLEKRFGDRWKGVWEDIKLTRKAQKRVKYARNAFDVFHVRKYNKIGAPRKTDLVALILLLERYFKGLTAQNYWTRRKPSVWSAISECLYQFFCVAESETDLASWVKKRSLDQDIKALNWDAFLDSHLQYYAEHREAIDAVTDRHLEEAERHLISMKKSRGA